MNYDKLFEVAKAKGIEDLQLYFSNSSDFDIEIFQSNLEKYSISDTSILRVKGIYDKKMGTVTTEVINDDMIDFIVDSIIASAKAIDSEDEVFIYAGDKEYTKVEGLFSEELEQVEAKRKIEDTLELEKRTKALDERIKMVQAFYGQAKNKVFIRNSKGLSLEKEVNNAAIGVYVIASDGNDQRTGIEYIQTNDYNDINLDSLAKEGANKALALLGASPVASGDYEILLTNSASSALLAPHISMFSAESVQKGVSLLKGKLNEKIGSSLITLVDDPFRKNAGQSGSFDDEGVATKYKEVIKEGTLSTYLNNLKTAKKDGVEPTGNGFNRGISPTNFYFLPGTTTYDEAVASMKKGLIITDLAGTHSGTNPISGAFSLQASGFLVEDGKIVKPVALITVAGNYLDLLNDVVDVCDDLKFNFRFIGSPSLKIRNLVVSGL